MRRSVGASAVRARLPAHDEQQGEERRHRNRGVPERRSEERAGGGARGRQHRGEQREQARAAVVGEQAARQEQHQDGVQALEAAHQEAEDARGQVGDAEVVERVENGVQVGPESGRGEVLVEPLVDEGVADVETVPVEIDVGVLALHDGRDARGEEQRQGHGQVERDPREPERHAGHQLRALAASRSRRSQSLSASTTPSSVSSSLKVAASKKPLPASSARSGS